MVRIYYRISILYLNTGGGNLLYLAVSFELQIRPIELASALVVYFIFTILSASLGVLYRPSINDHLINYSLKCEQT